MDIYSRESTPMSTKTRFDRAYKNALVLPFNDSSKFILFSDCHRGDNSFADDFARNRHMYFHAMKHYYKSGFSYIELGDGDELWENRQFEDIYPAHTNVYKLLKEMHKECRFHPIYGNHDMVYKNKSYLEKHLSHYFDPKTGEEVPLFPGITYNEAIILKHETSGQEIFMAHGHQADWWNYLFWKWGRFLVRVLWKPLQVVGIYDPTSPAKNYKELIKVEKRTKKWIRDRDHLMTICGHTHRPRFPEPGETPYFNDGSCVHPRSITGIEIENGSISLIKWQLATDETGVLKIERVLLEGPQLLSDYMKA